jgi:hypothetical protein
MYGSEKYMLHNIKDKCSHYLKASVDEERVCVVLQTAHDFHLDDLRTNALKFILIHQYQQSEQSSLNSDGQQFTPISTKRKIISEQ